MDLPPQIPTSLYVVIGALFLANIASVISIFTFIFKAGMFVSETKTGIMDAKNTGVRAHKRIDNLEFKTIGEDE